MLSYRCSVLSRPLYAAADAHGTTQGWPRCGSLLTASPASSPAGLSRHRRRRRGRPGRARRLLLEEHPAGGGRPRTRRPPRAGRDDQLPVPHAQPDAGRHRRAAHRDDAGLPRLRQGDLARGRCRRHRAAGPAHRPHRSDRLPARRRQCPRRARFRRSRLRARQGRPRSLPDAARQRRLHDPDARHAAVGFVDDPGPRRTRPGASSRRPRTTSPTPSCMPTPRASSRPSRPRSARCWRRARAW